ncbi:hypothetical protein BDQ12DRAFT_716406 [Crucibulum laeve]|uniref:Uncharacterized protein n=1 Tax=Crucibulum laeve TaxID=68775 RepID=A0A5C3LHX9_9AGAR|nr:hypothetical protein BDQ12DRAFT_716406 [Crucibulum laeve]
MAHKNEHLLDTLCPDAEIKSLALAYLRIATVKTAQGSGHTLSGLTTGLPAACAFLASEKLISDKFMGKQAQVSTYISLSELHKVLIQHDAESPEVKGAIFFLIYMTLNQGSHNRKMKGTLASSQEAIPTATSKQYPSKRVLREPPTKDSPKKRPATPEPEPTQENDDAEMAPPETPVKRRKLESPAKLALRSAPSKPTLRSSPVKPIFPVAASASSSKVTLDVPSTRSVSRSPTRRQPDRSPARLREPELSPVRRKPGRPPARASTAMDVDTHDSAAAAAPSSSESEEEEEDVPPPRRFRPVYLDHEQWGSRDPRITRLWRQGERHKKAMVDLYGHPFARYHPKVAEVEA